MKKISDWRKLAGKPHSFPAHLDQPTGPMQRNYPIVKIAANFTREGPVGSHAYDYAQFMKFVEKVKRVHELNPAVRISRGPFALHAVVRGMETPSEQRVRLVERRRALKQTLAYARGDKTRAGEKEAEALKALAVIQPLIGRKSRAKKRRKPK
ncbi:hypothetical protein LCGC14_0399440 [marine sediment metagenome]|uniref:Uncharacterized protein n=1 Tax=marine sediment metagenome TaxID=412755 RepID=A0A0F9TF72_9ZZZZ